MMHFGTSESGIAQLSSVLLLLLELSNVTERERERAGWAAPRRRVRERVERELGRAGESRRSRGKGGWWYKRPALTHCVCTVPLNHL